MSKAGIVDAALGILDQYGLADLSMRRIADALGVPQRSVEILRGHHARDKVVRVPDPADPRRLA